MSWLFRLLVGDPPTSGPIELVVRSVVLIPNGPADEALVGKHEHYTCAAVFANVANVLTEVLGVELDEIRRDQTLTGDLGSESIDFLDIVFRLDKAFDIKIDRAELFAQDTLLRDGYVVNGKVTDEGLALLREQMPDRDLSPTGPFGRDRVFANLDGYLTVHDLCACVERKLAALGTY